LSRIVITTHAKRRAYQRGIREPTPRRAFQALRRGTRVDVDSWLWRDIVWVFDVPREKLLTVYWKKWEDSKRVSPAPIKVRGVKYERDDND